MANEHEKEEEISPAEDLMREHGVLNRLLLIYENVLDRLRRKEDIPPESLLSSAKIVRGFIEDYHEKLEEDFLFPRFEKAGKLVDLVRVLKTQHQAGRQLTDAILYGASQNLSKEEKTRRKVKQHLESFIKMYRPHEAREDTVLFPAFRSIVSSHEYDSLGEEFERKEHELFGEEGFHGIVSKVEVIEKNLGIYDLSQFTPKASKG